MQFILFYFSKRNYMDDFSLRKAKWEVKHLKNESIATVYLHRTVSFSQAFPSELQQPNEYSHIVDFLCSVTHP